MTGNARRGVIAALLVGALAPWSARPAAAAEKLVIRATIEPARIAVGDQAELTVVIEADGLDVPHFALPAVAGLHAVRVADSQSFSWVNGRLARSSTTAFAISASAPGRYTIPPIRIASGLTHAESSPITLDVGAAGSPPPSATLPAPGGGSAPPPQGETPPRVWGDQSAPDLFVRLVVDHPSAYWNQQITARYFFYTRVRLEQEPTWDIGDAPGFWKEILGEPKRERTHVGSQEYVSFEQDVAYFPTRPGKLVIGPGQIEARVVQRVQAPDPWSMLGIPDTEVKTIALQTERVTIDAKPLPPGAPSGFQGAVGRLGMSVRVDRLVTRVGEPFTVTTMLAGDGNLNAAGDPVVAASLPLRSYETGGATTAGRAGLRVHGERRHETAFVPEVPGHVEVLPVRFAWFDPEEGRYRTQLSDTIHVRVLPSGAPSQAPGSAEALGPPAALRGKPGPGGSLSLDPPAGAAALALASALAFAGALAVGRARRRAAGDPRVRRRLALARLETEAHAAARAGGKSRAAAASRLATILPLALGIRFDADVEGRSLAESLRMVADRGAPQACVEEARRLAEALERVAFAPADKASRGEADPLRAAAAFLARLKRDAP
ncbi:MAG TPA: BatD family protein [Candidatus Eisenbacteria bacterium]